MDPLEAALNEVRGVFARAEKPSSLANRMEFIRAEEERQLLGRPLADLGPQDFYDYWSECGGSLPVGELAYFVPRMCEIMAGGESAEPNLGWVCSLNCLEYADFPASWPNDYRVVMQGFVEALLVAYVEEPERFRDVEHLGDLICMAGKGGIDMPALLAVLKGAEVQALSRALALWVTWACFLWSDARDAPDAWRETMAGQAYWAGKPFTDPVLDWLVGLQPWQVFAEARDRETDPEWRPLLDRAATFAASWPERRPGAT